METKVQTSTGKLPEYKKLVYQFNEITRYYDRIDSPPGFEKLPPELKVEETRRQDIIRSQTIVHGRIRAGKYLFFTGIIPVSGSSWYYFGDHYELVNGKKKNSFILFHFAPGNGSFTVYYFPGFKLYPRHRAKFISEFIRSIKQ